MTNNAVTLVFQIIIIKSKYLYFNWQDLLKSGHHFTQNTTNGMGKQNWLFVERGGCLT